MMKRNESFTPNYLSMLDLLSSALAAVILLFVMTPQNQVSTEQIKPLDLKSDSGPQSGQKFILKEVHFYGNSETIIPGGEIYIRNELIPYLKRNSHLKFKIIGHTNSLGAPNVRDTAYQSRMLSLSKRRARSVYNMLIAGGITPRRMSYEGKGDTEPIVEEVTAGGDLYTLGGKNRRVEIVFQ